ncbi:TVP38/TMEM64 family protein [Xylanibacillus composti]|uniref:TVP38/TMEM64 family membrane protein n=1 Tax=Xylanibacillus composti TaxID=1572762 RepID=A0A8J4M2S4_9BACL|nr:VTT domain-containing protein [Xylanibacillus composti]MDT9725814.1 TVP38/TMEM64 family protein [Xylanibacillus composti]GIQ69232.1 TVP38/TMEM64 family protein [Xylanibacillus composti]
MNGFNFDQWKQIDKEAIEQLLDQYAALGPLPGILLPLLESFIPVLPLIVILLGNAASYGTGLGFLYSWIGVVSGSSIVFLLARRFGSRLRSYTERKLPKAGTFFHWIENKGFTPIFLLACFPFTPSFLVNVVSGMSMIPFRIFLIAIMLGKGIMIFLVSLVGGEWRDFVEHPSKLALAGALLFAMWLAGKQVESKMAP